MTTPHCYVCGRWDGTHSGGCERTGHDYVQQANINAAQRFQRSTAGRPITLNVALAEGSWVTHTWDRNDRHDGPADLVLTFEADGSIKWEEQ